MNAKIKNKEKILRLRQICERLKMLQADEHDSDKLGKLHESIEDANWLIGELSQDD